MKYGIISINDDRKEYKDNIRKALEFEEVALNAVNGAEVGLTDNFAKRNLSVKDWNPRVGESGVWLSMFDAWQTVAGMDEPLIVFEDDAIISNHFHESLDILMEQLPSDWSFMSLWVPDNQRQDYWYDVKYRPDGTRLICGLQRHPSFYDFGARHLARAYQGYGMVATLYNPECGRSLVDAAVRRGVTQPVDCFLFKEAYHEENKVRGFAPKPMFVGLVEYDWSALTTIHDSEYHAL